MCGGGGGGGYQPVLVRSFRPLFFTQIVIDLGFDPISFVGFQSP